MTTIGRSRLASGKTTAAVAGRPFAASMPSASVIPPAGIRLKLFLTCMALTIVSVAVIRIIATHHLDTEFVSRIRDSLFVRVELVAHEASRAPFSPASLVEWDELADQLGVRAQERVTLIAPDGSLLGDSELPRSQLPLAENHLARPEVAQALATGRGFSQRRSPTLDRRMLYVAVPVRRGDQLLGVARLAMPLTDVDAVVTGVGRTVFWGAGLALLVATALTGVAAQALSRRTRRLTEVALQMSAGRLEARADGSGHDELATLGRALNDIVTSHSRAAAELKRERRLLEQVVEAMREGLLVLDGRGRVALANSALRRMLLLDQDIVGRSAPEELPGPPLARHLARAVAEPVTEEVELTGLKPRRLLLDAGPHPAEAGGVVAVFVDVTELRRLEAAPRDFASAVSLQLRAPLEGMAAAAAQLQGDPPLDAAAARPLLDTIDHRVRRLQGIVNEILELSRLQSQDFQLHPEPQDLERAVAGVFARFGPQAEEKRIHLQLDVPRTVGKVLADGQALQLLLSQLVGHVLRSCPRDATLRVRAVPDGPWANIFVTASGRASDSALELSLLSQLTQAMRGRLAISDEPGQGFRLVLLRA